MMARSLCMPRLCYAKRYLTAAFCAEHNEHDVLLILLPRRPLGARAAQGCRPRWLASPTLPEQCQACMAPHAVRMHLRLTAGVRKRESTGLPRGHSCSRAQCWYLHCTGI